MGLSVGRETRRQRGNQSRSADSTLHERPLPLGCTASIDKRTIASPAEQRFEISPSTSMQRQEVRSHLLYGGTLSWISGSARKQCCELAFVLGVLLFVDHAVQHPQSARRRPPPQRGDEHRLIAMPVEDWPTARMVTRLQSLFDVAKVPNGNGCCWPP